MSVRSHRKDISWKKRVVLALLGWILLYILLILLIPEDGIYDDDDYLKHAKFKAGNESEEYKDVQDNWIALEDEEKLGDEMQESTLKSILCSCLRIGHYDEGRVWVQEAQRIPIGLTNSMQLIRKMFENMKIFVIPCNGTYYQVPGEFPCAPIENSKSPGALVEEYFYKAINANVMKTDDLREASSFYIPYFGGAYTEYLQRTMTLPENETDLLLPEGTFSDEQITYFRKNTIIRRLLTHYYGELQTNAEYFLGIAVTPGEKVTTKFKDGRETVLGRMFSVIGKDRLELLYNETFEESVKQMHMLAVNSQVVNAAKSQSWRKGSRFGFVPSKDVPIAPLIPENPEEIVEFDSNKPKCKYDDRKYLGFFAAIEGRGSSLKNNLSEAIAGDPRFISIDPQQYSKHDFYDLVENSKFCILPPGRKGWMDVFLLYIDFSCIPVVISDDAVLPLSCFVEWDRLAVVVPTGSISNLPQILNAYTPDLLEQNCNYMAEAKKAFVYPDIDSGKFMSINAFSLAMAELYARQQMCFVKEFKAVKF